MNKEVKLKNKKEKKETNKTLIRTKQQNIRQMTIRNTYMAYII